MLGHNPRFLSSQGIAASRPIFLHTVLPLFQFLRSPQRLNFMAKRFGRFHHHIPVASVDSYDAHDATFFLRDFIVDQVPYAESHGVLSCWR